MHLFAAAAVIDGLQICIQEDQRDEVDDGNDPKASEQVFVNLSGCGHSDSTHISTQPIAGLRNGRHVANGSNEEVFMQLRHFLTIIVHSAGQTIHFASDGLDTCSHDADGDSPPVMRRGQKTYSEPECPLTSRSQ